MTTIRQELVTKFELPEDGELTEEELSRRVIEKSRFLPESVFFELFIRMAWKELKEKAS